jgi:hypothetical protein
MEKLPKVAKVARFNCEKCAYNTSKKSSWAKHIVTIKHQLSNYPKKLSIVDNKKVAKKHSRFYCKCGKNYQFQSGLCKHRKKCYLHNDNNFKKEEIFLEKKPPVLEKVSEEEESMKEIFKEFLKSQAAFNEKMAEVVSQPKTVYNDCGNQKMTINVFLNEQCKDALNLTDWVNNIKVTLEDLKYTKDNGFVDGVGKMLTKRLQDLKPTERPIHCSDTKRLQFYVKDDDKWEKDIDNKKLDSTITNIKLKSSQSISEWEKLNPTYRDNPALLDEWMNMIAGITEGDTGNGLKEKLALKRKIATYIELKEAMANNE